MTSSVNFFVRIVAGASATVRDAYERIARVAVRRFGRTILLAITLSTVLGVHAAHADIDIVVAADNTLTHLNPAQTANVFLSRTGTLPNGEPATPVDLNELSAVRDRFYRSIVGRTGPQMKAYWSRLIFTGQGEPPRSANSPEAVKKMIVGTPGAIGYLDSADVDKRVKVLLHLP